MERVLSRITIMEKRSILSISFFEAILFKNCDATPFPENIFKETRKGKREIMKGGRTET